MDKNNFNDEVLIKANEFFYKSDISTQYALLFDLINTKTKKNYLERFILDKCTAWQTNAYCQGYIDGLNAKKEC